MLDLQIKIKIVILRSFILNSFFKQLVILVNSLWILISSNNLHILTQLQNQWLIS